MEYPPIIALSGKRGAGKDTAADLIEKITGEPWGRLRFSGILKNFVADWLGLTPRDLDDQEVKARYIESIGMTVGELLQVVGGGMRELVHPDFWVIGTMNKVQPGRQYLCTDCRYPNELKAIEQRGGQVIRIVGDPLKQQGDGTRNDQHSSETALDDVDLPTLYNNSSKHTLRTRLVDMLYHLQAGKRISVQTAKRMMAFKAPGK